MTRYILSGVVGLISLAFTASAQAHHGGGYRPGYGLGRPGYGLGGLGRPGWGLGGFGRPGRGLGR
jgi:hypothetical protein